MNKYAAITITAISLIMSTGSIAEGFNDNYAQLGYTSSNYKFTDSTTSVSGSFEVGNNYVLLGNYEYSEGDWKDPGETEVLKVDSILIGAGKNFNIDSNTDITSSLSYVDFDTKQTCTLDGGVDCTSLYSDGGTNSSNYYIARIGIRNLTISGLEMSLNYSIWRGGKLKPKGSEIELGLMKNISENYAVGGSVLSHKKPSWTEYGVFVRRLF